MGNPSGQKLKIKGLYRKVSINADASGTVPTRIELLRTGIWPASSNKGPLEETLASLNEYKRNFDGGIGQSKDANGDYIGLPIDYKHESWDRAAGWIKSMEVAPSPVEEDAANGVMSLFGNVEWTPAAEDAIKAGEFKCISPSWWPASRGDWTDPEDPNITARNVIDGAGLTNIPFFKGLQSLTASNSPQKGEDNDSNVIFIKADKEINMPTLDEVRVKELASLTDEEKKLLADNKASLSADEQAKFGLVEASAEHTNTNKEGEPVADPEQQAITAAIKSGEMVAVKASVFNELQTQVKASTEQLAVLNREKIEASLDKDIARGAIKADSKKDWADRIVADASVADLLKTLPDNPALAGEIGSSVKADKVKTAYQEVKEEAAKKITAAREANSPISEADAVSQVMQENSDLASRYEKELSEQ